MNKKYGNINYITPKLVYLPVKEKYANLFICDWIYTIYDANCQLFCISIKNSILNLEIVCHDLRVTKFKIMIGFVVINFSL